nr:ABC transporter permease [Amphibacillus sp. MSJ-3]
MFQAEWMKLNGSKVWLLIFASPILSAIIGFLPIFPLTEADEWLILSTQMIIAHSALFLPLLTGLFAALLCSFEHGHGGWKQLLALPVKKLQLYGVKFIIIMILLAFTQCLFILSVLVVGTLKGFYSPFPLESLLYSAFMGWLACLPLAALQYWLATMFTSFAGPSVVNVLLTFPAMIIANSQVFGPLYPWAHPVLAMTQAFSASLGGEAGFLESSSLFYVTLICSFIIFTVIGMVYFQRKQWN